MPPIPTVYDEEVTQLIESAQRRQKDIVDFQIPRLRTCNGPLALQQRLFAELREDIDLYARELQSLELLVADQRSEKVRRELQATVSDCQEMLASVRRDSRGALLTSKRLLDSLSKSNREELLRSNVVSEKKDVDETMTEDKLIKANNDVTDALRRTMNLMQGELERSVLTTQMLETSTASLRSTSTTHDTLTNLMGTSKHLITALEKADWLDRLLILAALSFFVLVVLFILKQRIVDRGLRVAFWWTRFLPGGGIQREDILGEAEKELHVPVSSISIATSLATAAVSSIISAVTPSLAASLSSTLADSQLTPSSSLPEATSVTGDRADHVEL
ncbi:Sec20-domain-containing protein [Pleurotus eryngii]|uniref:Sec20-domain-containing protein n=1 Tax=Pleurotus eryngii TaxID=5323 RepID=A0A9P6D343_PLEER|nr:Sec20-domain-containing protein [Pleurotus eryngii]